jgi:superfamily II DNA/RNA helicase
MSVEEIVENPTKGVTGKTVQLLRTLGVTRWTQMQEDAMDKLYLEEKENSKDGLICASTGSGKTYAFLMPVLMRFLLKSDDEDKEDKTKVKAIAVLPTRELAQQVFEKAKGLFEEANGINVCLCVGGVRSHEKDAEDIIKRKPKLVVGTPGRMLELKKLNVLDLSKIEVQILDEIDRLLDGGFENDVLDVLRPPGSCQTICATATARGNLRRFLNKTLAFGYKEIGGKVTTTDENGLEVHNSSSEIGGNVAHCAYAISKSNSDNETAQIYAQAILTAFKGLVTASSSSSSNLEKSQCLCFVETKSLCDKIEVALQKESMAVSTFIIELIRLFLFVFNDDEEDDDDDATRKDVREDNTSCVTLPSHEDERLQDYNSLKHFLLIASWLLSSTSSSMRAWR